MAAKYQLNANKILKRGGADLLKGAIATLASLLGLVIGGMLAGWLNLPTPDLLYYALNLLDGLLFTPMPNMSTGFFSVLFPTFFAAAVIAWLIYPPIYYLIGRVAALFTLNYYQDPSLNLGLTLPPLGTLLLMRVRRGALFLQAVIPILCAWQSGRSGLWSWVGMLIFIQIANQAIVQACWLPLGLRTASKRMPAVSLKA